MKIIVPLAKTAWFSSQLLTCGLICPSLDQRAADFNLHSVSNPVLAPVPASGTPDVSR